MARVPPFRGSRLAFSYAERCAMRLSRQLHPLVEPQPSQM